MNRFDVIVESFDRRDGFAWLRLSRGRLAGRDWPGIRRGEKARVRIRPDDVLLCVEPPGRVSARNVLAGHVRSVRRIPDGVYITVDVGFGLVALVTRRAVSDLRLRPRVPVYAVVKATAVVPEVPFQARLRASLVGRRGLVGPRQIDYLRAVEAMGSLAAAGRALGITYRTAWLWSREINRRWGSQLLAHVRGGRGGGGARLTPEGKAALNRVAAAEKESAPLPRGRKRGV